MTSSFIALMTLRFLTSTIAGVLTIMPALVLFSLLIKNAKLSCKAKQELKRVLQERDSVVAEISRKTRAR